MNNIMEVQSHHEARAVKAGEPAGPRGPRRPRPPPPRRATRPTCAAAGSKRTKLGEEEEFSAIQRAVPLALKLCER